MYSRLQESGMASQLKTLGRWGLRAPVAVSLPLPRIMAGLGRVQVTGPASLIKCILDHPAATANLQKAVGRTHSCQEK